MTADERRAMRELLRAAIATAVLPGATPEPPGAYVRRDDPPADLVARFTAELSTLGGFVHDGTNGDVDAIARIVASVATGDGPKRALLWDDRWLPVTGLPAALEAEGFGIDRQDADAIASPEHRAMLAAACVGITGVDAGLAETGSIVLVSGPGRGRLASLLPPVHVALMHRSALTRSLPDLFAARPELASAGSNLVCITGPSRTADIEHTLSRGVHGPREVHVILLDSVDPTSPSPADLSRKR